MEIMLCVQLWAHPGAEEQLTEYEDAVLRLVPAHGGEVLQRVRRVDDSDGPLETQIIRLPGEDALASYMADPARLALGAMRDESVARTELTHVRTLLT